jgi:hypothetical protein
MVNGGSLHLEPVHWDLLKTQERMSFQSIQQEVYGILFALGYHAAKLSPFHYQPNHQTSCWTTPELSLPKNLTTVKNLTAVTDLIINTNNFEELRNTLSESKNIQIKEPIHGFSENKYLKPNYSTYIPFSFYTIVHRIIVNRDLNRLEAMIQSTTM